jgi:inner membrane protein
MGIRIAEPGSVTGKALIIGAVVLLLMVPLSLLKGLVSERAERREQAYQRVAEGWGGSTVLGGPMLVIPTERTISDKDGTRVLRCDMYLLPSRLDADVTLRLDEPRYVGIYAVPVYLSDVRLTGAFDFAGLEPLLGKPGVTYLWSQARLRLPLSQVRSLREVQRASFAGQERKLGPAAPGLYRGIDAPIDLSQVNREEPAMFDFGMVVAGSREFSMLPLGSTTSVQVRSAWPHPSFQGAFLPVERSVAAQGFDARWQVLELNRAYRQAWLDGEVDEATLVDSALGVGLYQAVDAYQRGERAIKYALLFIALTFLTFFAWEHTARIQLHPLQYLLVGLALSTFYLLLIAISEHLVFALAYVTAAVALVLLTGIYIAGALHSSVRGIAVAVAMSGVYALLYVLVLSEDYALLLGAIILFTALAVVMLTTRKVDWYRLGSGSQAGA